MKSDHNWMTIRHNLTRNILDRHFVPVLVLCPWCWRLVHRGIYFLWAGIFTNWKKVPLRSTNHAPLFKKLWGHIINYVVESVDLVVPQVDVACIIIMWSQSPGPTCFPNSRWAFNYNALGPVRSLGFVFNIVSNPLLHGCWNDPYCVCKWMNIRQWWINWNSVIIGWQLVII